MKQNIVKKKANHIVDLTEMQRRFCEYIVMNPGRTTYTDAALSAGYEPKRARIEGSELMDNPKIIRYLKTRMNEVNRSYVVTKNNYIFRQIKLSEKIEKEEKASKTAAHEALIGKASGMFVDIHLHGDLNAMTLAEKREEIERLHDLKDSRMKGQSAEEMMKTVSPPKNKKKSSLN